MTFVGGVAAEPATAEQAQRFSIGIWTEFPLIRPGDSGRSAVEHRRGSDDTDISDRADCNMPIMGTSMMTIHMRYAP
jgi:hypothetical protein